jgi:hypothetical protein
MTIYTIYDNGKNYKFVVKTAFELWAFNREFKEQNFRE